MREDPRSFSIAIDLDAKVRALRLRSTYPMPVTAIRTVETHFAWVFLTEERAYKLKKPMRIGEMDLSSIDMRALDCREEVRLNRRLAGNVYLGVVPLVASADGTLRIGGTGSVVDWLVEMRTLPQSQMLDRAIADGTVKPASLQALGTVLTQFYLAQQRIAFEPEQYIRRLDWQIESDRKQLLDPALGLDASQVEELIAGQSHALQVLSREVGDRAATGRIVEAHGDLRPEHICLSDPPCVIDSLEFSLDLRTLDALEELAFFCVECAHSGADWIGAHVLDAYRLASNDAFTPALFDFYRSRRACVRARLVAWHLLDPLVRDRAPWSARAHAYLQRAMDYARSVA